MCLMQRVDTATVHHRLIIDQELRVWLIYAGRFIKRKSDRVIWVRWSHTMGKVVSYVGLGGLEPVEVEFSNGPAPNNVQIRFRRNFVFTITYETCVLCAAAPTPTTSCIYIFCHQTLLRQFVYSTYNLKQLNCFTTFNAVRVLFSLLLSSIRNKIDMANRKSVHFTTPFFFNFKL